VHARTTEQVKDATNLFREYAASLRIDLSFQDFKRELLELPGEYSEPG
jgi:putative acetyltransferase